MKTVIFDFGGVLGTNANDFFEHFEEFKSAVGLDGFALFNIFLKHWSRIKRGASCDKFYKEIIAQTGTSLTVEQLHSLYCKGIKGYGHPIGYVMKLKQRGVRLGMICNEGPEWWAIKKERFHLDELFDIAICSAMVRIAKPDSHIFQKALKDLGVSAEETIFVDDADKNIAAAKRLGMHAVRHESLPRTIEIVESLLSEHP